MKRNILNILGSLNTGGAENLVFDSLHLWSLKPDKDVDNFVVYMHKSVEQRLDLFKKTGANITYIPCGKGSVSTLKFIGKLRRYIIRNKITHIKCHNNIDAYWVKMASIGSGVKEISLTIHGFNLNFTFLKSKFPFSIWHPDKAIIKNLNLIYVSKTAKEVYNDLYGWDELEGRVEPNKILLDKFKCLPKSNQKRYKEIIENGDNNSKVLDNPYRNGCYVEFNDKMLFGMVGNFNTPVRLQRMLCEAILIVKNEIGGLPFRFVFAGGKNDKLPNLFDNCLQYCKENNLENDIIFLGSIDNVPQLMARLDCYIYASSADAFGLSILEAKASKIPIICSDIPTFREVTNNGSFATLTENTPQAFANKILEFLG